MSHPQTSKHTIEAFESQGYEYSFFFNLIFIVVQWRLPAFSPHPCTPPQPVWVSYGYIVTAIMKILSTQGQMKTFNTCASQLMRVILFYGSGLFSYLHSRAGYAWDQDKVVSMLYGAVIPILNPIIYSLRNKKIKDALKNSRRGKSRWLLCVF